ncbi:MAG TPA: hypothetical protein DHW14_03635 [Clostridiales bacterium]|nr:hypothetical protein [Clostridiales bacterium]
MKALKVITLFLIAVMLYLGLTVLQTGAALRLTTLDPDFYAGTLRDFEVYQKLPDVIMETLPADFLEQAPSSERARLETALREALRPEWLQGQVEGILHDTVRFLRGQDAELRASVALTEFKAAFVAAYEEAGGSSYGVRMLERALDEELPDTVLLAEYLPPDALDLPPQVARGMTLVDPGLAVLAAVLLLLALVCFPLAGGFPGGARWIGATLVLSGLTTAAGTLPLRTFALNFLTGLGLGEVPPAVEALQLEQLVRVLASRVLDTFQVAGLAAVALGVLLLVLAAVAARSRGRRAEAETPAAANPTAGAPT